MENKIEITKQERLEPGDIIEIVYNVPGLWLWLQAASIAILEERIKTQKNYQVINTNWDSNNNKYSIRVQIVNPDDSLPSLQKAGINAELIVTGIIALGAGLLIYLTLDRIYKIVQTPGGSAVATAATSGLSIIGIGIVALLIIKALKEVKSA